MSGKKDPNAQPKKVVGPARASQVAQVSLKGEKGQYNEILRPSEREDAYLAADNDVENLRSQTTDSAAGRPSKREQ